MTERGKTRGEVMSDYVSKTRLLKLTIAQASRLADLIDYSFGADREHDTANYPADWETWLSELCADRRREMNVEELVAFKTFVANDLTTLHSDSGYEVSQRALLRKVERLLFTDEQKNVDAQKRRAKKVRRAIERAQDEAILAEAAIVWKMMRKWHGGKPLPTITIKEQKGRTRRSFSYVNKTQIVLRIQRAIDTAEYAPMFTKQYAQDRMTWATLVHELAHQACPPIYGERRKKHGQTFGTSTVRYTDIHHREFYYCIKHVWETRWQAPINFGVLTGNGWGYSVDSVIEEQGKDHNKFLLPHYFHDTNNPTAKKEIRKMRIKSKREYRAASKGTKPIHRKQRRYVIVKTQDKNKLTGERAHYEIQDTLREAGKQRWISVHESKTEAMTALHKMLHEIQENKPQEWQALVDHKKQVKAQLRAEKKAARQSTSKKTKKKPAAKKPAAKKPAAKKTKTVAEQKIEDFNKKFVPQELNEMLNGGM